MLTNRSYFLRLKLMEWTKFSNHNGNCRNRHKKIGTAHTHTHASIVFVLHVNYFWWNKDLLTNSNAMVKLSREKERERRKDSVRLNDSSKCTRAYLFNKWQNESTTFFRFILGILDAEHLWQILKIIINVHFDLDFFFFRFLQVSIKCGRF